MRVKTPAIDEIFRLVANDPGSYTLIVASTPKKFYLLIKRTENYNEKTT
jgi:hypothetical protein